MATSSSPARPANAGIPDSGLAGPYPVGEYAAALRAKLRSFARVQLVGELVNLRPSRARVYFELRDATGAIPCAAWRDDWDAMAARAGGAPTEGMQVVVAGGCDYYPGSATSSPGFSFAVRDLRIAGEGDLLARIERLRKQLRRRGPARAPEASRPSAAAAHDRRYHRRGRQGGRRHPRRSAPAWLGGTPGVGLCARAGPPCGAGDRARARRPGGGG